MVGTFCRLLGPLLSTLLSHSQLADHNLPSSLLPRMSALSEDTVGGLQKLLDLGFVPPPQRNFLCSVTASLASLAALFKSYRDMGTFDTVFEVQGRVMAWLMENPEWKNEVLGSERILQNCSALPPCSIHTATWGPLILSLKFKVESW